MIIIGQCIGWWLRNNDGIVGIYMNVGIMVSIIIKWHEACSAKYDEVTGRLGAGIQSS